MRRQILIFLIILGFNGRIVRHSRRHIVSVRHFRHGRNGNRHPLLHLNDLVSHAVCPDHDCSRSIDSAFLAAGKISRKIPVLGFTQFPSLRNGGTFCDRLKITVFD